MQDIRATPINVKTEGRSGRGGLVDPTRNNSVPAAGEPSWMVFELRSPTNAWHKHRRTPSDSSSSFGSSQLSPISSVESSPTRRQQKQFRLPQSQKRPHTSAGNGNGQKPNTLTLKVVHSESKTNIILAVQKGLFSLPQIKSKIQNKLRMAAEIELDPNWKIRLTRIDQEQFAMYSERRWERNRTKRRRWLEVITID
ncbi:hypothetical protein H4Q26_005518 [Puccinia striiformis f. sp. tritici PST-130]|nr:hypothetical protein H4Q26_005518 [Puccinia striiformis f. sp. tritici PST-130]